MCAAWSPRGRRQRRSRVMRLDREFDALRIQASDRTRSIDAKASFVVVAAGVLATGTLAGAAESQKWLAPLMLTLSTIIAAAIVLWPRKSPAVSARNLSGKWLESDKSAHELEEYLVKVKARDVTVRNAQNENRAGWLKLSFSLLVITLIAVGSVAASEDQPHPENNMPQHTPEPTTDDAEVDAAFEVLTHGDDTPLERR